MYPFRITSKPTNKFDRLSWNIHKCGTRRGSCCRARGTTMDWKWFSRICEGEHLVEPDPSVHNPPSHRLHHWRHQQRNFMNAYFQIHNNRSSSCVTNKTVRLHRLTHERVITVESYGFVSYARQAFGTRPCRQRYDILRITLCGCKRRSS